MNSVFKIGKISIANNLEIAIAKLLGTKIVVSSVSEKIDMIAYKFNGQYYITYFKK